MGGFRGGFLLLQTRHTSLNILLHARGNVWYVEPGVDAMKSYVSPDDLHIDQSVTSKEPSGILRGAGTNDGPYRMVSALPHTISHPQLAT